MRQKSKEFKVLGKQIKNHSVFLGMLLLTSTGAQAQTQMQNQPQSLTQSATPVVVPIASQPSPVQPQPQTQTQTASVSPPTNTVVTSQQSDNSVKSQEAQKAPVVDPVLDLVATVFKGQFAKAKTLADAYITAKPQDPTGYILRGMALDWSQVIADKPLDETVMADYQKAVDLSRALVQSDASNLDNQVLLGNSLMYWAKKHVDLKRKMRAGQILKEASQIMEGVIRKDPNRHDAYFAIGMFNYFAANVPSGFKWQASLVGIKGDGAKGLSYIQKAAQSPTITQLDAQYILFYIYSQKMSRYDLAYTQVNALYQANPDNPLFWFDLAEMQMRTKKFAESQGLFDKFLKHCEASPANCRQKHRYLANFFTAWGYIDTNQHELAKPYAIKAHDLDTKVYKDRTKQIKDWYKILKI